MKQEFGVSDLGKLHFFLGIEVLQHDNRIAIYQRRHASEVLKRFGMANCNDVKNPIVLGSKLHKDLEGREVDGNLYKRLVGRVGNPAPPTVT